MTEVGSGGVAGTVWSGGVVPRSVFSRRPAAIDSELDDEMRARLKLPVHPSGRGLVVRSSTSSVALSCLDREADTSLSLLHRNPKAPPTCHQCDMTVIPQGSVFSLV